MSLTTKKVITPEEKKKKIEDARLYHSTLLKDNGAKDTDFNFKLAFYNEGVNIVGIFPNEFTKKNGFFLELVNSTLDPINDQRKVYKLSPRENYEDIYKILPSGTYAVPLEDLEEVKPIIKGELNPKFIVETTEEKPKLDDHYSHLTIKDLAAILWQKPVSEKQWLNDLVIKNMQQ